MDNRDNRKSSWRIRDETEKGCFYLAVVGCFMVVMGSRHPQGGKDRKGSCGKGNVTCECTKERESMVSDGVRGLWVRAAELKYIVRRKWRGWSQWKRALWDTPVIWGYYKNMGPLRQWFRKFSQWELSPGYCKWREKAISSKLRYCRDVDIKDPINLNG